MNIYVPSPLLVHSELASISTWIYICTITVISTLSVSIN